MSDLREHSELEEFLAETEERGTVTTSELEALAVSLDLEDDELASLRGQLAERNVEIIQSLKPTASRSRRVAARPPMLAMHWGCSCAGPRSIGC